VINSYGANALSSVIVQIGQTVGARWGFIGLVH
jgi:hypothetical protein